MDKDASELEAPWEADPATRTKLAGLSQKRIVRSLNAKSKMMVMTAGWVLAAGATSLAAPLTAQAAPGIEIIGASPSVQSFDGIVRSEISPDGDNINDQVAYTVKTDPGAEVQLTVNYWLIGQQQVTTLDPVTADNEGRAVLVWNGRDSSGNIVPDGGYNLTFCRRDNPESTFTTSTQPAPPVTACEGSPDAVVKKRNLSVTLPGAIVRSVQRGKQTMLHIDSDRASGFAVKLTANDSSQVYVNYGIRSAGDSQLMIPKHIQTGQYRIDVTDRAGENRTAPLVVRSQRDVLLAAKKRIKADQIAPHTVLVIAPSLTWRAYNFADANFDGFAESWYTFPGQSGGPEAVSLTAAYEHPSPGLEHGSDEGYWQLRRQHPEWLMETITDYELGLLPQGALNQYAAVVFPGHTEYYTNAMLHRLRAYRASGGHMVFWGANNFYARVRVDEQAGIEQQEHRPVYTPGNGRADFSLLGNGYVYCCFANDQFDYEATAIGLAKFGWLFAGTGLAPGDRFGHIGSEVDSTFDRLSPNLRMEIAGTTMDYFDANLGRQTNPRVSMLWLPPTRSKAIARGGVLSTGSLSFLTGISANDDPVDAARMSQIVANVQTHLASLPHPHKIKPKPKPPKIKPKPPIMPKSPTNPLH